MRLDVRRFRVELLGRHRSVATTPLRQVSVDRARELGPRGLLGTRERMPNNTSVFQTRQCRLETGRLILRLPDIPQDAAAIAAHYKADEDHLQEFSPASPAMLTEEFWTTWIDQTRAEFDAGLSCKTFLYELDDRTVFGSANISNIVRGPFQACYLGYTIARTHEGRGLMREALQALIGFAFGDLNLHRIMANYMPHNARSAGLLKRLGFAGEGVAPKYLFINGQWREHVLSSLTNEGWQMRP